VPRDLPSRDYFRPLRAVRLFHSGFVLKAEDLDGSPSLVDAIGNQIVSVDEFQDTEMLFYFGAEIKAWNQDSSQV
jgi:hypothetical protein